MNIKVLFNNKAHPHLLDGWGVSFLIDDIILFDTGEASESLMHNISQMKIDLDRIEAVVISHAHWDHIGGLWELLQRRKNLPVYICKGVHQKDKDDIIKLAGCLIEVSYPIQITSNIFSAGEMAAIYKGENMPEQTLVIRTEKGLVVITGCAHPGIVKTLEKVKSEYSKDKLHAVIGGFHLKDTPVEKINEIVGVFQQMGIEKVGPLHCSGEEAIACFKKEYKDNFIDLKAGDVISI